MRSHDIPSLLQVDNILIAYPKYNVSPVTVCINKSIDVLQFPHKSYTKRYFFCAYVVAKKKLLVIRVFQNKQYNLLNKVDLFFSLLQGNLSRYIEKGDNVRFIKHIL